MQHKNDFIVVVIEKWGCTKEKLFESFLELSVHIIKVQFFREFCDANKWIHFLTYPIAFRKMEASTIQQHFLQFQ